MSQDNKNNSVSFKKVLVIVVIIFLMSRAKYIIGWISQIHESELLTLEPIRYFPDDARAAITVVFYLLVFVVIWKLILNK